MNKKGYTLVELIVVIVIIASIGIYGVISLNKTLEESKNQKYNEMIEYLKDSANTYFTIYSEYEDYSNLKDDLYGNDSLKITIKELKDKLLVDEDLKNPKDNQLIDNNACVIITYDNINSLVDYKVCPYESCSCN